MNKKVCLLLMALLISAPFSVSGSADALIHSTLRSFLTGLQGGDTAAIESLMGGQLLEEMKVLLRQNKTYPQFLRHYYQGATFEITQLTQKGDQASAELTVVFPGGEHRRFQVRLEKEPSSGSSEWKIIEYVQDTDTATFN